MKSCKVQTATMFLLVPHRPKTNGTKQTWTGMSSKP
jgi:hypothetical protein